VALVVVVGTAIALAVFFTSRSQATLDVPQVDCSCQQVWVWPCLITVCVWATLLPPVVRDAVLCGKYVGRRGLDRKVAQNHVCWRCLGHSRSIRVDLQGHPSACDSHW